MIMNDRRQRITEMTVTDFNSLSLGARTELIKSHIERGHCKADRPKIWADKVLYGDFSPEAHHMAVTEIIAEQA